MESRLKLVIQKLKQNLGWLAGLLVALLALIDPKHIDELASRIPRWEALILALWGVLLSFRKQTGGVQN